MAEDSTAMIIAGLGAAFSFVAGLLATVVLAKFGSLTKKGDKHTDQIHAIELSVEAFKGFTGTAAAKITALEANTVTREIFDYATRGQNQTLAEQTATLHEIREDLRAIDKTKASRSDLRAARVVERAPTRREDGPSDNPPPMPPPRPTQKSAGRY